MDKARLDRINELARKKKSQCLSPAEAEEQRLLRQEFLAEIRADVKASLDSIEFVDGSGPKSAVSGDNTDNISAK